MLPPSLPQRFLKYGTALAAKTESDFNSVERVVEYLQPDPEAAEETAPDVAATLPKDWPASEWGLQGCVLSPVVFEARRWCLRSCVSYKCIVKAALYLLACLRLVCTALC